MTYLNLTKTCGDDGGERRTDTSHDDVPIAYHAGIDTPPTFTIHFYDGGCASRRNPKETNLLKSENTSRFCPSFPLALPSLLDPVGGPLSGGEVNALNTLSAAEAEDNGSAMRLVTGLPTAKLASGSISRDVRKDVLSRSVLVLVIVRNESRRLFCSVLGVPFRSRICRI